MDENEIADQPKGMTRELELLALPAAVDLDTGNRALGLGRSKGYELAKRGQVPVQGPAAGQGIPGRDRRPVAPAGPGRLTARARSRHFCAERTQRRWTVAKRGRTVRVPSPRPRKRESPRRANAGGSAHPHAAFQ
jgi:hypothetical protein